MLGKQVNTELVFSEVLFTVGLIQIAVQKVSGSNPDRCASKINNLPKHYSPKILFSSKKVVIATQISSSTQLIPSIKFYIVN